MAPRIGVVLSGCGVFDGSEIHEAVLTLLFLDRAGADVVCLAPDTNQSGVVNHLTGEAAKETRNVLVEAARIARGKIRSLADAKAAEFDALVFPGGFGAAKNLSDFAVRGAECQVHPAAQAIIREMHDARKPLGFICISPAVAARAIGSGVEVTIGNDPGTATAITKMGARHVDCAVDEIHHDKAHNVVTTPAYMYEERIANVAKGIEKLAAKIVELATRR